ncbi:Trm112 family protein [Pseudodesulfovibrio pelocollis]|uniref:Trm112 family protein n=1 Tax=Pseudodesulfovibrio pelocollis TaxID=3051432 RepID=UPI00255B3A9D|nr:Trm112 family protein [Pseudodesulfovibrio sp. SB368]
MTLDKELIDMLACPRCRGAVAPLPADDGLACPACAVVYPVRDGIPVMLADQAVPEAQWSEGKANAQD